MGEVVGAGLLSHVPTIVLPEATRRALNQGNDTTLVAGLRQLREEVDYDTVVVLDSHWATTVEFVVTAHQRRSGLFTSEELPRGMSQRPYDFPGDPELAHLVASKAERHGIWITAIDDDHLPIFYATTNLWEFPGQGLPEKRWVSIAVCQTAGTEDHLRLGRALGDAIAQSTEGSYSSRQALYHIRSGRCASCVPMRLRGSSTSLRRRLRQQISSAWSGSRPEITHESWRPCRSITASSRRLASAITS